MSETKPETWSDECIDALWIETQRKHGISVAGRIPTLEAARRAYARAVAAKAMEEAAAIAEADEDESSGEAIAAAIRGRSKEIADGK